MIKITLLLLFTLNVNMYCNSQTRDTIDWEISCNNTIFNKPIDNNNIFTKKVAYIQCTFKENVNFINSEFSDTTIFHGSTFCMPLVIENAVFDSTLIFKQNKIKKRFMFKNISVNGIADFSDIEYDTAASGDFSKTTFNDSVSFSYSVFNNIDFNNTKFQNSVNFDSSSFRYKPNFENTDFKSPIINLQNTQFDKGVDFSLTNFISLTTIYLEKMKYPIGELKIKWEILQAENSNFKIKLLNSSANINNDFKRIENIYNNLKENYLAQNNIISANEVEYELQNRKNIMIGDLCHDFYGCTLGWGYRPLRILWLLIIPLIFVFSFVYSICFKENIFSMIDINVQNVINEIREKELMNNAKISINKKYSQHTNPKYLINIKCCYFKILYHSVFFSITVFLSFRFRRDWLNYSSPGFLLLLFIEYIFSLVTILYFIMCVKIDMLSNFLDALGIGR